jgi:FixJ family two-component response regulator
MQARTTVVAVVDDDPSMLRAADDLLGAHGFATLKFSSADEFLEGGAAAKADCLLLDIHLGGMSGLELRQKLKASHPKLPVIFMTALADEAIRQQAVQAGCATFLQKPFPAHQLIQAINSVVPGHN